MIEIKELSIKKLKRAKNPWVILWQHHVVGAGKSPEEAKADSAAHFDALAKESLLMTYEGRYPGGCKTALECVEKMALRAKQNAGC